MVTPVPIDPLDQRDSKPKGVTADSLYANCIFLAIFLELKNGVALVR
jgi:hypothetical protein